MKPYAQSPWRLARNARIIAARQAGRTFAQLSEEFHLTETGIHAIVKPRASRRKQLVLA